MTQPTTPAPNLKTVLFDYINNTAITIQFEIAKAKITRAKFNALVRKGFTEKQALRLCQDAI